jgi:GNAT superfamily N-acetyltransferase
LDRNVDIPIQAVNVIIVIIRVAAKRWMRALLIIPADFFSRVGHGGHFPGIDSRIVILVPGECQSLAGGAIKAKGHAAKEMQGQRLGTVLLADALRRAYGNAGTVGSSMVIVDALDEGSADFYASHGFIRLPDSKRLVISMRSIAELI